MPSFCAVVGCGSRGNRDKNSFFRIPCIPIKGQPEMVALKTERRMKWILALRRKDLTESKLKYASICDRHFISGRPAATRDIYNPDWVPSQNMGYDTSFSKYRNQTTHKAIICYVTPSVPKEVQEESEVIIQDEDSQSRTECSLDLQTDQNKKQEKNRDAIICYIKASNVDQTQVQRTECKAINLEEDSSLRISLTYTQDKQTDLQKQMDWNSDAVICSMTSNNQQQIQVKRNIGEIVEQNRDS